MNPKDYVVIIDFALVSIADDKWEAWKKRYSVSDLESEDIVIDTGRGEFEGKLCEIRRFRIKKEKMEKIKAL